MKSDVFERSQKCIAQGALTNSKNPRSHVFGVFPTHVKRGEGCYLFDMDGKKYIDFICGLGANYLGYGNESITRAVYQEMHRGWAHSLPTYYEVETAEAVKEMFPFVECMKFLKTGTEACMASVKIARAATGRNAVLSEGYHGWSDPFVSLTPPANGVPADSNIQTFTDISQIGPDTAAVIVEPVIVDATPERKEWLESVRKACSEHGAMLIFDEVITGFRFKEYSVSKCWGVTPDIVVLGKAMANGLPIAVVGGKADVMNGQYFVSSTFAGEVLSLTAAKAVIRTVMARKKYDIDELWRLGQKFIDAFNGIAPDLVKIRAYPTRGVFQASDEVLPLFLQESCKAGILFCKSWFYNWHLTEHHDRVINTCGDILVRIQQGAVRLEGEPPQSPFAMKARKL